MMADRIDEGVARVAKMDEWETQGANLLLPSFSFISFVEGASSPDICAQHTAEGRGSLLL